MADQFKDKYRTSLIYSGVGQLLERVLSIAVMVVVIRLLSREHYGVYGVIMSTASIIGVVASWGWPAVYTRFIPELVESGDRDLISSLAVKGVLSRFVVASLCVFLLLVFYEDVGGFLNIAPYRHYFTIFSAGIVVYVMVSILRHLLNAHFEHPSVYRAQVTKEVVRDLGYVLVLLLGFELTGVLIVESIALAALTAVLLVHVGRHVVKLSKRSGLRKIPSRIRRYGAFAYLNDVGGFFLDTSIDAMIITKYMGVEAVAVYTVAATVPKRLTKFMPTSMLRNVLEPITYEKYSSSSNDQTLNNVFNLLTKFNFVVLIPIFAVIVAFGADFLRLAFGEKYVSAYPYFVGMSFFFFAHMFPIGYVTKAAEKMHLHAASKVFSVYNLVLDIVLIQYLGLMGIVLATGTAQVFKELFIYWRATRTIDLSFPGQELGLLVAVSTAAMAALKLGQVQLGGGYVWLFAAMAMGIATMVQGLGGTWYFDDSERGVVEKVLSSVTRKERMVRRIFAFLGS